MTSDIHRGTHGWLYQGNPNFFKAVPVACDPVARTRPAAALADRPGRPEPGPAGRRRSHRGGSHRGGSHARGF
jgi:hypothetical protein